MNCVVFHTANAEMTKVAFKSNNIIARTSQRILINRRRGGDLKVTMNFLLVTFFSQHMHAKYTKCGLGYKKNSDRKKYIY